MGILGMKWCACPSNSGWLFFKIIDQSMLNWKFHSKILIHIKVQNFPKIKIFEKYPKNSQNLKNCNFFIFGSISAIFFNTEWSHNPFNLRKNPKKFQIFFVWFHSNSTVNRYPRVPFLFNNAIQNIQGLHKG